MAQLVLFVEVRSIRSDFERGQTLPRWSCNKTGDRFPNKTDVLVADRYDSCLHQKVIVLGIPIVVGIVSGCDMGTFVTVNVGIRILTYYDVVSRE